MNTVSAAGRHAVWLYDSHIGWLFHHHNYSWFEFCEEYFETLDRPVLGLRFEDRLRTKSGANLRLPPWFSNLLPEGTLRTWIAAERDVSPQRELELLAQVGHDLPGAVRVLPDGLHPAPTPSAPVADGAEPGRVDHHPWKFSLAGVGMKFSLMRTDDKFTCTASGQGGDWIVKLPDARFPGVPLNEYVMMRFAAAVGIDVPEVDLVHRDNIEGIPQHIWPHDDDYAYAIKRFDRTGDHALVHIEDLAQVRGFYPEQKYDGNFETVAALIYRGHDSAALQEFVRRLVFSILIGNGDAHLKNWSLIYYDKRIPTLSPAYDIMATEPYPFRDEPEDLGMKFGGGKRFDSVRVDQFARLAKRLRAPDDLEFVAVDTVRRTRAQWQEFIEELDEIPDVRDCVHNAITSRAAMMLDRT